MRRGQPLPPAGSGFTLIELMIVVAIIGILAAVAIPKFADMLRKAKEGATKGSLTNLRSSLSIYYGENNGDPPLAYSPTADYTAVFLTATITPKYIDAIPTVKLGTYHADSSNIKMSNEPTTNRSLDMLTAGSDTSGWTYSSISGGVWWVNCSHTDIKRNWITVW